MDPVLNYIQMHIWPVISILVIAWVGRHFGGMVIRRIITNAVHRSRDNEMTVDDIKKRQNTLIDLLTAVWKWLVVIVASIMLITELLPTVDLAPVFASAGIIGIALGFGAQSLIKDFLSGLFIISENQYRVGDVVDLEGAAGTVEHVGLRSTILRDADGNVHYIPNGNIMHVINKTMGYSKVNFTLSVHPDTDIDTLSTVINEAGQQMFDDESWKDKLLEAPYFLNIGAFSDTSMEVTIVGKTAPSAQWSVTGELRRRLLRAFHKNSIELAQFPLSASWSSSPKKK
ncbi:MAG: mechanosensitive ion channel family protein [Candidatus Saccharimonadales bacterium]